MTDPGGVTAGAGGFELDPDHARQLLDEAVAIRSELNSLRAKAPRMHQVTPPAQDPASVAFNSALVKDSIFDLGLGSGVIDSGEDHISDEITYLTSLIRKLQKALDLHVETDQESAAAVAASGQGSTDTGTSIFGS